MRCKDHRVVSRRKAAGDNAKFQMHQVLQRFAHVKGPSQGHLKLQVFKRLLHVPKSLLTTYQDKNNIWILSSMLSLYEYVFLSSAFALYDIAWFCHLLGLVNANVVEQTSTKVTSNMERVISSMFILYLRSFNVHCLFWAVLLNHVVRIKALHPSLNAQALMYVNCSPSSATIRETARPANLRSLVVFLI